MESLSLVYKAKSSLPPCLTVILLKPLSHHAGGGRGTAQQSEQASLCVSEVPSLIPSTHQAVYNGLTPVSKDPMSQASFSTLPPVDKHDFKEKKSKQKPKTNLFRPSMVVRAINPSTWKTGTEAGGSL